MAYLRQLRQKVKQSSSIVYLGESGFDGQVYRPYGWGTKGQRIDGDGSGKRGSGTRLLLAQCGLKRFSPLLFSGTCTMALFNRWLEQSLIPVLRQGRRWFWIMRRFTRVRRRSN